MMLIIRDRWQKYMTSACCLLFLSACTASTINTDSFKGLTIKMLVGSALDQWCKEASNTFNEKQPRLDSGIPLRLSCEATGSGDVVTTVVGLAQQLKTGMLSPDSPQFPTLISVDGEIYQNQLIYQINQLFPGQHYIPEITDSPLLANSPMVFMVREDLAKGMSKVNDLLKVLVTTTNHQQIDPSTPPLTIHYVQTAPTRSNSGLQTLVAQFAAVSGKRPEQLTVEDITRYQTQVQKIQNKVTRYGISTNALAKAMVQNGPFWATIASVYESSVIEANSDLQPGQLHYQAIYPKATFTSNMRVILPNAPWVSPEEKAGVEKVIAYLRSPEAQKMATDLGLRPGVAGVPLSPKFSPHFGVQPHPRYDSYRPPKPVVVNAMLKSWQEYAKKPSLVVLVVDTSGSMEGKKITAVQNTLLTYINGLGSKDQIALMDFNSEIHDPILIDGTAAGRNRGIEFVSSLKAGGGTKLYKAALYARNWLQQHLRKEAINAVLILTDGEDTASGIGLEQLSAELQKSGFNSDQRISFFTVGYGNDGEFNPDALKRIANLNGGYYSKGDPQTISQVMSNLQVEF
jgi:Ca-activated chloride channel family protein